VEGIYNVDKLLRTWPSYRDFVIQGFGEDPAALIQGSPDGQPWPANANDALPRYAVIHSNQDELVDPAQAIEYHAYLQSIAGALQRDWVAIEFGDWGSHDDMLQTTQFTNTITKYIQDWEARQ